MLKIFVLVLLICTGCAKQELQEVTLPEPGIAAESVEEDEDHIFVYVCGAVNMPGVYELPEGSRVYEAIEAAGGLLTEAADDAVNQAQVLKDETKLYIPTQEEMNAKSSPESGKIKTIFLFE